MKLPLIAGLVIFVSSLAAFVVLTVLRLDTTGLLAFVGMAAGIGGFGAWSNTETIKKQTNGPLQKMGERVSAMEPVVHDISTRLENKGV